MFYDRFVELCTKRKVSPTRAALEIGLSKSTPTTWKKRALTPQGDTLNKIAAYFDVSTDYLLGNDEAPLQQNTPALTKKDERDISKKLEETLKQLETEQGGLMFDGEPLDDTTRELLAISLRNSMEMGKKLAKEKYTPKKYRK